MYSVTDIYKDMKCTLKLHQSIYSINNGSNGYV